MKWIVRNHRKAERLQVYKSVSGFKLTIEPDPNVNRFRLLPWVVGAIFIFALLYCSGYLALFWLPMYEGMDMKSQLAADYRPWSVLVFQPVDPAIIDEIRQERGLPEQIVTDALFLPTLASTLSLPTPAIDATTSTSQATSDHLPSNPTAYLPLATSTPMPASITLPSESTVAPQLITPANPARPQKTPKKTKKPPKHPKTK